MRVVCISDTHELHEHLSVPDGDVLVHAGDCTMGGDVVALHKFNKWLGTLPHKHKICIAGNHDWCFENENRLSRAILSNAVYLEDESITISGIRFYGSPWQPWFCDWAFNLTRGKPLADKWSLIPEDTDVLITHGPPAGILDYAVYDSKNVGCDDLLERIKIVKPQAHIFGHLHEGANSIEIDDTLYINASSCDLHYKPINEPIVLDV